MAWEDDPQKKEGLDIKERRKTRQPRKYKVIFHNDDYTTMEFVIHVLKTYFHKSHPEATATMLRIHHQGRGVAGVYTRDVAATKIKQVTAEARADGMPLKLTMEPE